ncbi:GntR family transcriptional regulator [Nocardioides sp. R1-1]|uniref:GntR family transcriptional regulator n=1 Tax=Nocardioides sp. R1-1 TaxID=3383502 RepID=UPI0038D0E0EE
MITLDPSEPTPPYEQIRSQLAGLIGQGELTPGTRLPTVRRLAADLGVATNTVARAYRELEQAALIETRGRAGSFVSGPSLEQEAQQAATAYLHRMRALGVSAADAVRLVQRVAGPAGSGTPAAGT